MLGCTGLYWAALGCNELYCPGCPGGQGGPGGPCDPCDLGDPGDSGGPGGPGVQVVQVVHVDQVVHVVHVVQVVQVVSPDDMHSENIWFSNYQEKFRCHACDGRTDGKWKIEQYAGRPGGLGGPWDRGG